MMIRSSEYIHKSMIKKNPKNSWQARKEFPQYGFLHIRTGSITLKGEI